MIGRWFYLFLFGGGTVIAWIAWGQLLRIQSPEQATNVDFVLLYALLFLAVFGTMVLFGTLFRKNASDRFHSTHTTLRQAMFYALFVVGLLFLQSFRLLRWWNFFFFLFALTLLEFFFLFAKEHVSLKRE